MVLPSKAFEQIRLVQIPDDVAEQEAFQHATGVIASVEEKAGYSLEDIVDALEEHGFYLVDYQLGPEID
jgi:transcriptional regulator of aromatic amino acid metabolism